MSPLTLGESSCPAGLISSRLKVTRPAVPTLNGVLQDCPEQVTGDCTALGPSLQGKVLVLTLCLWLAGTGSGQSAGTMAGATAATLGHEKVVMVEDKEPGFLMVAKLPYWPHMLTQTVNQKKTCRHHYFGIPLQ